MILLIGSKYDITCFKVSSWLLREKAEFVSLNTEDYTVLNSFYIDSDKNQISMDDKTLDKIKVVWHRRGRLRHLPLELNNLGDISTYLKKEEDAVVKSLELLLKKNVPYIGSYLKEVENYKLSNLILAKGVGFNIPKTLVTTSKLELLNFFKENEKLISKDIRYPVNVKSKNEHITSRGTFIVTEKDINRLGDFFAPIFVQEYIEKVFELRVFFFEKKIYTMCIFSQNDTKTAIDYRNYNENKPNRCVPFSLPESIREKILDFSVSIDLKSGSIDLIYTENGDYVFLEINPMGQLDWVSWNCNYYIEKQIALDLINYD